MTDWGLRIQLISDQWLVLSRQWPVSGPKYREKQGLSQYRSLTTDHWPLVADN